MDLKIHAWANTSPTSYKHLVHTSSSIANSLFATTYSERLEGSTNLSTWFVKCNYEKQTD